MWNIKKRFDDRGDDYAFTGSKKRGPEAKSLNEAVHIAKSFISGCVLDDMRSPHPALH
jgi:hypothetical protein